MLTAVDIAIVQALCRLWARLYYERYCNYIYTRSVVSRLYPRYQGCRANPSQLDVDHG